MIPRWIQRRVKSAETLIAEFAEHHHPYVSCSWGKDSMVVLWVMRRMGIKLPVIWFDGGRFDEYPETAAFASRVAEEWELDVHVAVPDIPLVEQWRRFGPPDARGTKEDEVYTREFVGALMRTSQALRCDGGILGMRGDESIARRCYVFKRRGPVYFVKRDQAWRCCPIWNWSTRDVWTLIDAESIPTHPVYSQTRFQPREKIRLGVHAETAFAFWGSLATFKYYYPHLWNELCVEFPGVAGME